MFGSKKKYLVDTPDTGPRTPTERITGGPILVHGRKDLKARQKAAKAAGVELTVRKAPKS
ncbi:hypothetical protein OIE13_05845 [Streptosporangium sp. NBC_01810]|uniref:hypothetical protein n=1 Tax=Streptosporangium sp. NBC_01810 TaxID=2975951 RepID=UPI002DD982EC|nr:hypothetical protein [Streptosporangium sp. NBC_01810]WSA27395.1 hypothetical protein OIE13_05845 [Streptosporangium sp. NBC_01810]